MLPATLIVPVETDTAPNLEPFAPVIERLPAFNVPAPTATELSELLAGAPVETVPETLSVFVPLNVTPMFAFPFALSVNEAIALAGDTSKVTASSKAITTVSPEKVCPGYVEQLLPALLQVPLVLQLPLPVDVNVQAAKGAIGSALFGSIAGSVRALFSAVVTPRKSAIESIKA
jgi:hypothetical protein